MRDVENGSVAVPLAHERDGVEGLADRCVPGGVEFCIQPAGDGCLKQLVQLLVGEQPAAMERAVVAAYLAAGREGVRLVGIEEALRCGSSGRRRERP